METRHLTSRGALFIAVVSQRKYPWKASGRLRMVHQGLLHSFDGCNHLSKLSDGGFGASSAEIRADECSNVLQDRHCQWIMGSFASFSRKQGLACSFMSISFYRCMVVRSLAPAVCFMCWPLANTTYAYQSHNMLSRDSAVRKIKLCAAGFDRQTPGFVQSTPSVQPAHAFGWTNS
jgi:hypothetical protein